MTSEKKISIVIPALDEGDNLFRVLSQIGQSLQSDFECIVVVDSALDASIRQVELVAASDSRFFTGVNSSGKGPASALKFGFQKATGDVVVVLSADGSEDILQIESMVALVRRGVAIVSASRFMHGGQMVGSPLIKGLLSKYAGLSLQLFRRIGTKDPTNNYKAYSADFLRQTRIESKHGFEVALELIVKSKKQGKYVAEIPTIWVERQEGVSKFNVLRAIPRYLYWYLYAFNPFKS